ncbi:STAS domain-containing protein [Streptomyces sp. NPDC005574]|uniref:STAS domain-containing protein n=1 Tax=Streptomyces sp. NPDC005574 TaxID=3156891 RepID=UPI0033BD0636
MADNRDTAGHGRLSVVRDTVDGVTVLTVHGEIDYQTASPLQNALPPADGTAGPRIVIDLGQVTFIDSSGINTLITAQRAVPDKGWLRLAGTQGTVLRTLELVGLDTVIPCYPTVRDALA